MRKKNKVSSTSTDAECEGQTTDLMIEKEHLTKQVDGLQKKVYCLQIERDILEKAAEIIKKDQGVSFTKLTNHEKVIVINVLR